MGTEFYKEYSKFINKETTDKKVKDESHNKGETLALLGYLEVVFEDKKEKKENGITKNGEISAEKEKIMKKNIFLNTHHISSIFGRFFRDRIFFIPITLTSIIFGTIYFFSHLKKK